MPLTGVYGDTGTGKTTIVIYILKRYFPTVPKFGNFPSLLENWETVDILELADLPETTEKRIVVIDEGYTEYDNRNSMDEEQTFNTYLLMQHRKANMSIIGISQLNILDVRWRGLEKFRILCKDRPIYARDGTDFKGDFHYFIMAGNKGKWFTLPYKTALKIFPLFETKRKILPKNYEQRKEKIRFQNLTQRKIILEDIVKEIKNKMGIPDTKNKVTHDWVANALIEIEKNIDYERFVYVKIRSEFED